MDQKELRAAEYRCVQEEPAFCTAACPIHVDARNFAGKMATGAWEEALKILTYSMPLPGIVARICDHPCEDACKRGEAGGPVAISELERACIAGVSERTKGPAVPRKTLRVAIVGSSLSSLTAAWDLVRKGYCVGIFEAENQLGGSLLTYPKYILPKAVLEATIESLRRMGVEAHTGVSMGEEGWLRSLCYQFDAVYVGMDSKMVPGIPLDDDGKVIANPITLMTPLRGVFAGGMGSRRRPPSPILDVAEGRRGAISIDRMLQKVSLTAAREKEGVTATRLFTSIAGVQSLPRVPKKAEAGLYTKEEAVKEAQRCIRCQCMECVKKCLYLERFKGYPKRYIREIYNNETILIGSHGSTNKLTNSCMLCGLCGEICPQGFSMVEPVREGRRSMTRRGKMPPSTHEFALQDMLFSNSERCRLARHEPGRSTSAYVFFPGCQLAGSLPESVKRAYAYLRDALEGGVGLLLGCCGAPADWAGNEELVTEAVGAFRRDYLELGSPTVITGCPSCDRMLHQVFPEIRTESLWNVLNKFVGSGKGPQAQGTARQGAIMAICDPCSSRHDDVLQASARGLVSGLGIGIEELEMGRDRTECCGFGGLVASANAPLAKDHAKKRGEESNADFVTYCAMCRDLIASSGKPVYHLLDLLFETAPVPARSGRGPGYSNRQENRLRLREQMARELWNEKDRNVADYERIDFSLVPGLAERLEERRILREDIQKVLNHAVVTGQRLYNKETGHSLSYYRPGNVTYWVEYRLEGERYRIFNAYSHRMEIAEGV